ncbi:hypothetical protein CCY99_04000 [Helicobacter sp. 16-1353]|uniref:YraN family protein n=1 Tax=Helicobacter sp. 16-1353 TaxID=2004996 RepID=UPI000DCBA537|nr:YraN family protein [Helicobacter sp. 16-1353]RAX54184.1 hypothetical protein CCY99_04000 [Helicobacter sp. 16-1353]
MSRKKGNIAEQKARDYLIDSGFSIITSNYYTKYGEIDIIALKNGVYHFIEVKSGDNFEPLLNVTSKKLDKIIKSISLYLSNNNLDVAYCIDVITIKKDKIEFFGNVSM